MSVPLQALRAFPYASRRLKPGDQFEARGESDARLLCAIGHATRHVQVPTAITDPVPAPVATKRGKGYRKQSLEAQASTDAAPAHLLGPVASEAQASESGTAEKPEAGTLETAPPADDPAPTRRRYQRRDLTGTPE